MRGSTRSKGITRRDFLKSAGLGLTVNALPPVLGTFLSLNSLRVAVAVPDSAHFPQLGDHFVNGIKTYSAASGQSPNIKFHRIGSGSSTAPLKKILDRGGIDVLIAYVNPLAVAWLRPTLEEKRVMLLAVDPGSQVVLESDYSPFIRHHGLNLWQSNWAMAAHAVSQYGQRALIAVSQYESGFNALRAAQLGIEMSGGHLIDTALTHMQPTHNEINSVLATIRAKRPDFVFAAHSGSQAVEFLRAYERSGLSREIPLVAAAYTVDDAVLEQAGDAALGIQSAFTWASTQTEESNLAFMNAYRTLTAQSADSLALLGYETAQLLDHAAHSASGQRGASLAEAIASAEISTPRGIIRGGDIGVHGSPIILRQVNNRTTHAAIGMFDSVPEKEIQSRMAAGLRTGWLNAYLA